MNILHYTQHVLGIGHLFRSLAIDRALTPDLVHLVTGGPEVPLDLPANVCHHAMPALAMDSDFKTMRTVEAGADEEGLLFHTGAFKSLAKQVRDGAPVEARPIVPYNTPAAGDWYAITLRLMEV